MELMRKWENRTVRNWSSVRNQLITNEKFESRLKPYLIC